jgi:hypothetical protein
MVLPRRAAAIHGMRVAHHATANHWLGGFMAQSLTTSDTSAVKTQAQNAKSVHETGVEATSNETKATATIPRANQNPESNFPSSAAWSEALCCEARNSLQVVLSGAEILLEDHLGNLLAGQKELLAKMIDNANHLCNLLATLLGPEEFTLEESNKGRFLGARRVPAKVLIE